MFDSGARCPGCWATTLIRTKQTGAYAAGECMNCRADRSGELPAGYPPADLPSNASNEGRPVSEQLPEGVKQLGGNWFELADGTRINGKKALQEALAAQ